MQNNNTSAAWLGSIVAGSLLLMGGALATGADVLNNLHLGRTFGTAAGVVAVVAAFLVLILPGIMELKGKQPRLRFAFWMAVILTVAAGTANYLTEHGEHLFAAENAGKINAAAQRGAETARENAAKERAAANAIKEVLSATALKRLAGQAEVKMRGMAGRARNLGVGNRRDEDSTVCQLYKPCRLAQKELEILTARLGLAQSKTQHLASAKEYDAKADTEEAKANGNLATPPVPVRLIAAATGWSISASGMVFSGVFAFGFLFMTLASSTLTDIGVGLIVEGWYTMPPLRKKPEGGSESSRSEMRKGRSQKQPTLERMREELRKRPDDFADITIPGLAQRYGIPVSTFRNWYNEWLRGRLFFESPTADGTQIRLRIGNGRLKAVN